MPLAGSSPVPMDAAAFSSNPRYSGAIASGIESVVVVPLGSLRVNVTVSGLRTGVLVRRLCKQKRSEIMTTSVKRIEPAIRPDIWPFVSLACGDGVAVTVAVGVVGA
jgi:hypothetical protein